MLATGQTATTDDVANVLAHFSRERTAKRKDAIERALRAATDGRVNAATIIAPLSARGVPAQPGSGPPTGSGHRGAPTDPARTARIRRKRGSTRARARGSALAHGVAFCDRHAADGAVDADHRARVDECADRGGLVSREDLRGPARARSRRAARRRRRRHRHAPRGACQDRGGVAADTARPGPTAGRRRRSPASPSTRRRSAVRRGGRVRAAAHRRPRDAADRHQRQRRSDRGSGSEGRGGRRVSELGAQAGSEAGREAGRESRATATSMGSRLRSRLIVATAIALTVLATRSGVAIGRAERGGARDRAPPDG